MRPRVEDAHGMLAIVNLDANHSVLGVRRGAAYAVALVAPMNIPILRYSQVYYTKILYKGFSKGITYPSPESHCKAFCLAMARFSNGQMTT